MKTIKNLTFAALAVTLLFQTPITRADDHGPLSITFEKCWTGDKYEGEVDGDCGSGTVTFTFVSAPWGTSVLHFTGEYTIETAECSFKAVCGGILDTRTGHIVLNGVVTEVTYGQDLGARVQVRAQATDGGACSHGTMTITPSELQ